MTREHLDKATMELGAAEPLAKTSGRAIKRARENLAAAATDCLFAGELSTRDFSVLPHEVLPILASMIRHRNEDHINARRELSNSLVKHGGEYGAEAAAIVRQMNAVAAPNPVAVDFAQYQARGRATNELEVWAKDTATQIDFGLGEEENERRRAEFVELWTNTKASATAPGIAEAPSKSTHLAIRTRYDEEPFWIDLGNRRRELGRHQACTEVAEGDPSSPWAGELTDGQHQTKHTRRLRGQARS